ncbi:MAG: phosphatidylinositol-specific phospholipase C domain-containing protein [Christensenellales bacterium]|jgi:hypothetical protein
MKKTFIFILIVLALVFSSALWGCTGKGEPKGTLGEENTFFAEWMSYIKGEALLTKIAIPGTHDSGSHGIGGDTPILNMLAETQDSGIYGQLVAGARYFDIRVTYREDGDDETEDVLVIYHGATNMGLTFYEVCQDIDRFLNEYPSEFLILDFQHFGTEREEDVLEMLDSMLSLSENALKNDTDLATLTMADIRSLGARFIVVWGGDEEADSDYVFSRSDCLVSPYNSKYHYCGPEFLINEGFKRQYWARREGRLFVLQTVLTMTFDDSAPGFTYKYYSEIKEMENDLNPPANAYIRSLALPENAETLEKINIIMRDYFTADAEKARSILALNLAKGLVIEEHIPLFNENTEAKVVFIFEG